MLVFDDDSILIIDVGRLYSSIVDWLNDRPRTIQAIVLTHNDEDHAGGLCSLSKDHAQRIHKIYMLQDRPKKASQMEKIFRCAYEGEKKGYYQIIGAVAGHIIWENKDQCLKLEIIYPSFSDAYLASSPNDHSAMVVLSYKENVIAVWPGDLSLPQLHSKLNGGKPWVLVGPHHGAPGGYRKKPEAPEFISNISPARAFISVGTTNQHSHPRSRYLLLLAKTGCHVMCSELTRECDPVRSKGLGPLFPGTAMLGLRPPRSAKAVACRGSWRAIWQVDKLVSDGFDTEHLKRVATLRRPRCLQGRGWKKGSPIPGFPGTSV